MNENHYPFTTSIIIFPIRGNTFLLKDQSIVGIADLCGLSGFYHKPQKTYIDIRAMACEYLKGNGIETTSNCLNLVGIMDTSEEVSREREEHMFVYTCEGFKGLPENTSWTEFPGICAHLFDRITREILISITRKQPLPKILDNEFRCRWH